jgi:erythromycin esterase-like protein
MIATSDREFVEQLGERVNGLAEPAGAVRLVFDLIGEARFILIGEASHGTHDFYDVRAELAKRLIDEKGITAVVTEADWPDAWRVNRYARGFDDDKNADDALSGFKRFPQWMWRNTVMLDFVEWLRQRNLRIAQPEHRCGFYGMDLYSLGASIHEVLRYLDRVDPEAAKRARYRFSCFEDAGEDPQAYGYAAGFDLSKSCEREAVEQLVELRRKAGEYARRDGRTAEDEYFYVEQNARVVKNAEEYYRNTFTGRISAWNLRDRHMVETIDSLVQYLDARMPRGERSKVAVWAHNSHLGDARATSMGRDGEWNVGQLARERWGREQTYLIGFSTYSGTVTAAGNWDEPARLKRVRPGLPGSWEATFHEVCGRLRRAGCHLDLRGIARDRRFLNEVNRDRLQRAIGVIYRPRTERISHYFDTRLGEQFDSMIHLDATRALRPLEFTPAWDPQHEYETFPTGV